jgi:hypothetical protein
MAGTSPAMTRESDSLSSCQKEPENAGCIFGQVPRALLAPILLATHAMACRNGARTPLSRVVLARLVLRWPRHQPRVDCFIGRVVNRQSSWNVIDRVPVCNDLQILYRRILNSRGAALHLTNPDRDIQSPDWPLHDGADISQFVTQGIFPKLFPCARPKRPADGRKIDQHPGHDRRVQHVGACGNFRSRRKTNATDLSTATWP